jgi:hypothetical protein
MPAYGGEKFISIVFVLFRHTGGHELFEERKCLIASSQGQIELEFLKRFFCGFFESLNFSTLFKGLKDRVTKFFS